MFFHETIPVREVRTYFSSQYKNTIYKVKLTK